MPSNRAKQLNASNEPANGSAASRGDSSSTWPKLESVRQWLESGAGGGAPADVPQAGRGTAPPPCHLNKSHRSESEPKPKPSVTWAQNGTYVKLSIPRTVSFRGGPGTRKQIKEFSGRARLNLLGQLNRIDRALLPAERVTMTTLTYPEQFPTARQSKKHLDTVLKRFRRAYPAAAGWWKIEPQRRGAPHFHLLTVNPEGATAAQLTEWWATNWGDVVAPSGPVERRKHLGWHLGTLGKGNRPCTEQIRTWNGVIVYAAKYLGKKLEPEAMAAAGWDAPGRMWGNYNYDQLPSTMHEQTDLTDVQAVRVRRLCVRWYEKQKSGRLKITDPDSRNVRRGYWTPNQLAALEYATGAPLQITPLRLKYRRGKLIDRGGVTMFIPAALVEQIVSWALLDNTPNIDAED